MTKQSEGRVPGRARGGVPSSFGRPAEEESAKAEDFTIRGGEAFHLVLHVEAVPDAASLEALREAIRETTRSAVLEGYAAAFAEMDSADQPPGSTYAGQG